MENMHFQTYLETIKILDEDPELLLRGVLAEGNFDMISIMLDDGTLDPTFDNNILLKTAIRYERYDIVTKLIQNPNVNPNKEKPEVFLCKFMRGN